MGTSRQEKKARILAAQQQRIRTRLILITSLVAVAAAAVLIVIAQNSNVASGTPTSIINAPAFGRNVSASPGSNYARVTPVDGVVSFDVSDFADGKAVFFRGTVNSTEINFFVLKSSDGVLRAAFDACDVCFPARKGYRQEGNVMVCNNCGQRFASTLINVEKGGCNPSPLERHVDGEKLIIQVADIARGAKYF